MGRTANTAEAAPADGDGVTSPTNKSARRSQAIGAVGGGGGSATR
jgi:hypothetical protein